jgi:flavin-dependent dehydrogenase
VYDLAVIGAGPTGVAALYEASRRGLDAVAIEAGSTERK